ncbi:MAG: hypothetical protein KGS60_08605 [Verrucomicrobia bacterium]|nr:hypothetical protein [Verrucomicrobiota bacterium]
MTGGIQEDAALGLEFLEHDRQARHRQIDHLDAFEERDREREPVAPLHMHHGPAQVISLVMPTKADA